MFVIFWYNIETSGKKKKEGKESPSIDLVCYRNIWKETHKFFDPDKLSVVNTLSFPRLNPQTQGSNLRVWVFKFLSTKRVVGLIGTEKSCPLFVEINTKSIDRHDPEIISSFSRQFLISTGGTRNKLTGISKQALFYCKWTKPQASAIHGYYKLALETVLSVKWPLRGFPTENVSIVQVTTKSWILQRNALAL